MGEFCHSDHKFCLLHVFVIFPMKNIHIYIITNWANNSAFCAETISLNIDIAWALLIGHFCTHFQWNLFYFYTRSGFHTFFLTAFSEPTGVVTDEADISDGP